MRFASGDNKPSSTVTHGHGGLWVVLALLFLAATGCYAPLRSAGIPANCLPDDYRYPFRTAGPPLNLANLTIQPPSDYLLGANDVLLVTVPGLYDHAETTPLRASVMSNGEVQLPLVGAVRVMGMNLVEAQRAITQAYDSGFLQAPRVSVSLVEKSSVSVLVLGQAKTPGIHILPKYENDVGHAIAAAGGLTEDAAEVVEVHRKPRRAESGEQQPAAVRLPALAGEPDLPMAPGEAEWSGMQDQTFGRYPLYAASESSAIGAESIVYIPLRGPGVERIHSEDMVLEPGDVVLIPNRKHEVFFVVGKLNPIAASRFTLGDKQRELGSGFVLPRDREIDVVTAVAMAGYIDPIDSPTTVTVHRVLQDGHPLLIHVDLIKARYEARETVLVAPGDIIYLNPDAPWWFRRTFDRVIDSLITIPYSRWLGQ